MTDSTHRVNSTLSDANFKLSCDSVLSKLVPLEKSVIDSILEYDNPEQGEIILPDGKTYFWYFAIGSMTNPISLYLRDLIPIFSYPATCLDYKIVFCGLHGMADIQMSPGSKFDGVVHLLTKEQMIHLDKLEIFYNRVIVQCLDYQNRTHAVYAYQMTTNDRLVSIPQERYLDVIIKGCEYYKVRPEYINQLKTEQPIVPRKQPNNFQSFTDFPSDVYYSLEDLKKHDGSDPSVPLWITINGKILEYAGLPPENHPDFTMQQNSFTFFRKFGGKEVTSVVPKALYEPLYKLPLNNDDLCDEYCARIEDHFFTSLGNEQNKNYWKLIGRLRQSNNSSTNVLAQT